LPSSQDRTNLSALYTLGVSESSFTFAFQGLHGPDQRPIRSTPSIRNTSPTRPVTFYDGLSAVGQSNVYNFFNGNVSPTGDQPHYLAGRRLQCGRDLLVLVTMQVADEPLTGASGLGIWPRWIASPAVEAFPVLLSVRDRRGPWRRCRRRLIPFSPFYNIFLPFRADVGACSACAADRFLLDVSGPILRASISTGFNSSRRQQQGLLHFSSRTSLAIRPSRRGQPHHDDQHQPFSTYVLFQSSQAVLQAATGAIPLRL